MQKSLKSMLAVGAVALVSASQANAGCSTYSSDANAGKRQEVKDAKHAKQANATFKSSLLKDSKAANPKAAWGNCPSNKEWQGE